MLYQTKSLVLRSRYGRARFLGGLVDRHGLIRHDVSGTSGTPVAVPDFIELLSVFVGFCRVLSVHNTLMSVLPYHYCSPCDVSETGQSLENVS